MSSYNRLRLQSPQGQREAILRTTVSKDVVRYNKRHGSSISSREVDPLQHSSIQFTYNNKGFKPNPDITLRNKRKSPSRSHWRERQDTSGDSFDEDNFGSHSFDLQSHTLDSSGEFGSPRSPATDIVWKEVPDTDKELERAFASLEPRVDARNNQRKNVERLIDHSDPRSVTHRIPSKTASHRTPDKKMSSTSRPKRRLLRKLISRLCWLIRVIVKVLVTLSVLAIVLAVIAGVFDQRCTFNSTVNKTQLVDALQQNIFGQHIAMKQFERMAKMSPHLFDSSHEVGDPVVLFFVGGAGVGKTLVSQIITAQVRSNTLHNIIIPLYFQDNDESNTVESTDMYQWIVSNISQCAMNVFIIDEIHLANLNTVQNLLKAIDHVKANPSRLVSARAMFIITTSFGTDKINSIMFENYKKSRQRLSLELTDFKQPLVEELRKDPSIDGLFKVNINMHLIPFLPLEKEHVMLCTQKYLRDRHFEETEKNIAQVLENIHFFPNDDPVFSVTGCRKVPAWVDQLMET